MSAMAIKKFVTLKNECFSSIRSLIFEFKTAIDFVDVDGAKVVKGNFVVVVDVVTGFSVKLG